METEDHVGRHGWSVLVFLESRCIHKQDEISFDTARKDEHLTHALYTCFVAGTLNIILLAFQHYKYYLIPTLFFLLCFLFYISFLGDREMRRSLTHLWDNSMPPENNNGFSIKLRTLDQTVPHQCLSSFQDDIFFSVLQHWINNCIELIIMGNENCH